MSCPKPEKLTPSKIAEIKWLYFFDDWEQQALAWEYRQNQRMINQIVRGQRFADIDPQPPLKIAS